MVPPEKFPLRVRHAGTDPVHAAKGTSAGGHRTVCLVWLNPKDPHTWLPEGTEVTCTICADRLGPATLVYAAQAPGATGTLQERLVEVIENEVPPAWFLLVGERVAEAVENWRKGVEEEIHRTVEETLVGALPETIGPAVIHTLVERVLRSMDVGDIRSEGPKQ